MANEIFTQIRYTVSKNGARAEVDSSGNTDMAGDEYISSTQIIGTTAETISLGDISGAPGFVFIKNLDATNFVEIGGDSGLTVFKLKILPGKIQLISPSAATIYAKADTADVRIQILASEA